MTTHEPCRARITPGPVCFWLGLTGPAGKRSGWTGPLPSDMLSTHSDARTRVLTIAFDRPDKRNALAVDTLDALRAAVNAPDRAGHPPAGPTPNAVGAIVLMGHGPTFCAGFDLPPVLRDPPDQPTLRALLDALAGAIGAITASTVPIVAAVHGHALAGGCALAAACHVVVATPEAKFGYPVAALGLSPAISAPALLRRVAAGAARARLLDREPIDARRALELGLVDQLVEPTSEPTSEHTSERAPGGGPPAGLVRAAHDLAEALAAKPGRAVLATAGWLHQIHAALGPPLEAAPAALAASLDTVGSAECRQMLAAALARRP